MIRCRKREGQDDTVVEIVRRSCVIKISRGESRHRKEMVLRTRDRWRVLGGEFREFASKGSLDRVGTQEVIAKDRDLECRVRRRSAT